MMLPKLHPLFHGGPQNLSLIHIFKLLVDRLDEYDAIFPQHFMNDLESHMMRDVLEAVSYTHLAGL